MFELVDSAPQSAVIKVIGVGGGGGNAVEYMVSKQVSGVCLLYTSPSPRDSVVSRMPSSA